MLHALLVLFNLLRQLVLDQFDVVLVVGRLFSKLMLMFLHHLVHPSLSALFLVVVPLLKSVFFCLVERLQLRELLLGLSLHLADLLLVRALLFLQLPLEVFDLPVVTLTYLVDVPGSLLLKTFA